jgi:hypothetical protein
LRFSQAGPGRFRDAADVRPGQVRPAQIVDFESVDFTSVIQHDRRMNKPAFIGKANADGAPVVRLLVLTLLPGGRHRG